MFTIKRAHPIATLIISLIVVIGLRYYQQHNANLTQNLRTSLQGSQAAKLPTNPLGEGAVTIRQLGARTKDANCVANGALPDTACTPGAVFPVTREQVCVSGYAGSVRHVAGSLKNQVYQEYGVLSHVSGQYEVDHLISLELGGSNDIANLWPESAAPVPGFHQKDVIENDLHNKVCTGTISLQQAQADISTNWLAQYQVTP